MLQPEIRKHVMSAQGDDIDTIPRSWRKNAGQLKIFRFQRVHRCVRSNALGLPFLGTIATSGQHSAFANESGRRIRGETGLNQFVCRVPADGNCDDSGCFGAITKSVLPFRNFVKRFDLEPGSERSGSRVGDLLEQDEMAMGRVRNHNRKFR